MELRRRRTSWPTAKASARRCIHGPRRPQQTDQREKLRPEVLLENSKASSLTVGLTDLAFKIRDGHSLLNPVGSGNRQTCSDSFAEPGYLRARLFEPDHRS